MNKLLVLLLSSVFVVNVVMAQRPLPQDPEPAQFTADKFAQLWIRVDTLEHRVDQLEKQFKKSLEAL